MLGQQETEFVEQAFQKLKERGWLADQELERSTVTEDEIAAFEAKHQVVLPSLYKAYLMSFRIPEWDNQIMSITGDPSPRWDCRPLWLEICGAVTMEELEKWIDLLLDIRKFCNVPKESFHYLIPIGFWGAGWGPLCLDLSMPEDKVDPENAHTWSVVWFDHEDFEWEKSYLGEDGLLHGKPAAPDFKTLLEWYFYGSREAEFEKATGVKPTYEWYQSGADF